jgi:CBS domain-containing protein
MISQAVTIRPDQTVAEAMALFDHYSIRSLPVVNENNELQGVFSSHQLLKGLLPVSVTMEEGLQKLDFVFGTAPGVAKRLDKMKENKISDHMERDIVVLEPNTQTWEMIRLLVKYGSPLPVVDEDTGKLRGLMSEQAAIRELERIIANLDEEDDNDADADES